MTRTRRYSGAAIALALFAGACAGGDDDDTAAPPVTDASTVAPPAGSDEPAAPTPAPSEAPADTRDPVVVTLPPDTTPDRVSGGTFRYGLNAEIDALNPTNSALTAAPGLAMAAAVFDKLAEFTPDGKPVPYLAESFTPNAEFTEWDVRLRDGVLFHDGTPLDAEAVRYNFAAQYESTLVGLALKTSYSGPEAAEVIDPLTVRFHLLEPNATWPSVMASQLGMIASPTWVEAAIVDPTLNQQPVGTGPFKFVSRSEDSLTVFERNDDWWNGDVYLDRIEFRPILEGAAAADLLRNGDLDGFHTVSPEVIADFRGNDDFVQMENDASDESFVMMNASLPPFDDIRVRQALTYATPRASYIALIGLGVVRGADQMFIPESPYHNPAVVQEADDPARAAELVAEYCAERGAETNPITGTPVCTNGKVNIEYQTSGPSVLLTRLGDLLIEGWNVAFNVDRQELLQDSHILEAALGQYNSVIWQGFAAPDPMMEGVWLSCRSIGDLSLNFPRNCDEARDARWLEAVATLDEPTRVAAYQEIMQMIHDAYTYVFLTHTMWAHVLSPQVHGVCDRTSPEGVALACAQSGTIWPATIWLG